MSKNKVVKVGASSTPQKTIEAGGKEDAAFIKLCFLLIGLLFLIGNNVVNILFRKNIGVGKDGIFSLILSVLLFSGIGILFFYIDSKDFPFLRFNSTASYTITGILFIIMAAYVLFKGIYHVQNANKYNIHDSYDGESDLLSFLKEQYDWSEQTIKHFVEPFYVLFIGTLYFLYNSLGGLIIMFLALSVWLNPLVLFFFGYHQEYKRVNSTQSINKVSNP